jgi:thioredoxin 1
MRIQCLRPQHDNSNFYRIVKVDVTRFNKNVPIAEGHGLLIKKGIPAIAIVSADNKSLSPDVEELDKARKAGDDALYSYLNKFVQ